METAVLLGAAPLLACDEACMVRIRSPRIMTSGWMTVLPPSMMFCVPTSVALRATLLPVSVSMYSPRGGLRDDIVAGFSRRGCCLSWTRRMDRGGSRRMQEQTRSRKKLQWGGRAPFHGGFSSGFEPKLPSFPLTGYFLRRGHKPDKQGSLARCQQWRERLADLRSTV
jgi:hypothetical protein